MSDKQSSYSVMKRLTRGSAKYGRLRLFFAAFALLAVLLYCYLNVRNVNWYEWPYKFNDKFVALPCVQPESFRKELAQAAADLDDVMTDLNIAHFLVYGSLFGALRYGAPIPWDVDADIGLTKETLNRYSLARLQREFARKNFNVVYESYGGIYRFRRGKLTIDGIVFTDYYGTGWMYRVGYEAWLFFLNYRWHHNFPASLIKAPLPRKRFGVKDLPVPREGIEMQKYHYRDSWSEERPPPSCHGVKLDQYKHPS